MESVQGSDVYLSEIPFTVMLFCAEYSDNFPNLPICSEPERFGYYENFYSVGEYLDFIGNFRLSNGGGFSEYIMPTYY